MPKFAPLVEVYGLGEPHCIPNYIIVSLDSFKKNSILDTIY